MLYEIAGIKIMSTFAHYKKSLFTGLGASLFHIFCCGAPILLFFFGIQSINLYLFLEKSRTGLWGLVIIFSIVAMYLRYRKGNYAETERSRSEKSLYIFSFLTWITLIIFLYMSYSTAPYVLPLIKQN